jgi:hypothetical protein
VERAPASGTIDQANPRVLLPDLSCAPAVFRAALSISAEHRKGFR